MIKIITDDGADIRKSRLEEYEIESFPIPINDGENEYIMRQTIESKEFYEGMRNGVSYNTSQVARGYIENRFKELVEEGHQVIYLTLSSGLSGTYNNACLAREEVLKSHLQAKIAVVDSMGGSLGQGALVLRAGLMNAKNYSFEEIVADLEREIKNQMYFFTVGDLKYLYRGGRLSKTSAIIGGLLNIMPIIWFEKDDGTLKAIDKVRSKKSFFKKLKQKMNEYSKDGVFNPNQKVTIAHGQWPEMMEEAVNFLLEMGVKRENIIEEEILCVIGAHTGPEVFTIYYSQDPNTYEMYDILK